jgi:hypothetical protein
MAYVALIYCKTCGMRTEPEPNLCACLPGPVERVNNAFVDLRRLREENARLRESLQKISDGDTDKAPGTYGLADIIQDHYRIAREALKAAQ